MTGNTLVYTDRAVRDLARLDRQDAQRIIGALQRLREKPRDHIEKLKRSSPGSPVYSDHIGGFRAQVQLLDDRLLVLVLEVHQRKTWYRDF
jgi:mRNA interferase RelE/StbE